MRAYSMDLRERVWRACQDGSMSQPEVAEGFGVSLSFVTKLRRRHRDDGTLAAKPRGGNRPPDLGPRDLVALRRLVRERPDATLAELCRLLGRRCAVREMRDRERRASATQGGERIEFRLGQLSSQPGPGPATRPGCSRIHGVALQPRLRRGAGAFGRRSCGVSAGSARAGL